MEYRLNEALRILAASVLVEDIRRTRSAIIEWYFTRDDFRQLQLFKQTSKAYLNVRTRVSQGCRFDGSIDRVEVYTILLFPGL